MKRLYSFLHMFWIWFALFLIVLPSACYAEAVVVAVTYRGESGNIVEAKGTAFAIYSNERGSVLLTCKHVVQDNPESVWIASNGDWHQCSYVRLHPTEDVAVMECGVQLRACSLIDAVPDGASVVVEGAGPVLHKTDEEWHFSGVVSSVKTDTEDIFAVKNEEGLAIIQGDSGGPVRAKMETGSYCVCGIAYGYPKTAPEGLTLRSSHRAYKSASLFTPCSAFIPWIETQYGCGPQGCPIQIRRQVVVPVGPLGFQRGPARVIGVAEPVPQQYVPVPQQPRAQPEPQVVQCPPGPRGPAGPAGPIGPRGEPGMSITQEQVEATVNAWLDSNREQLRGEPGSPGRDCQSSDPAELAAISRRLGELESRPFRMVISSDGKIIDDETYSPGEPVVLDLKRLRSVSGGN